VKPGDNVFSFAKHMVTGF